MNPLRILLHTLAEERERWFLWLPVGAGVGIALYFALPGEPPIGLLAVTPLLLIALMMVRQRALTGLLLVVPLSLALDSMRHRSRRGWRRRRCLTAVSGRGQLPGV